MKDNGSERKPISADWLMRGSLTRIGDAIDRMTGRRWTPSSSLATSELINRIKLLLDAEVKEIPGKGRVVPHNITLKIQWDKFDLDSEDALRTLEAELLTATIDHINDSLYYTFAPVALNVKPDYFIEGVKLFIGFESFLDEETPAELNVTVPSIKVDKELLANIAPKIQDRAPVVIARFEINGTPRDRRIEFPSDGRISLGRTKLNDLVIDDTSVSKIHATLLLDSGGSLSIADTGSTNGTFINDQRIAYGKANMLSDGDVVKLGDVDIRFEHILQSIPDELTDAAITDAERSVTIGGFEFRGPAAKEEPLPDKNVEDRSTEATTDMNEITLPMNPEDESAVDE